MPIYNKPPTAMASNNAAAAAADDHAPEAAKMKRTREQAYFNSYNFDAIEVLPYEQDEENDVGHSRQHRRQQQPMPEYSQLRLPPPPTPSPPQLLDVGQQCSASNLPTLQLSAKSSNGRRRQAHASLSSKDNTMTTTASSRSGSSSSSVSRNDNLKYSNYLQRLGAFFMQTQRVGASEVKPPPSLDSNSRSTSSHSLAPEVLVVHAEHVVGQQQPFSQQQQEQSIAASAADKTDGGNFLLPRAMLKYQSVGVGAVVGNSTNSMPLAVNANTTHAGIAKSLQNLSHSSNNVGNANTATPTTTTTTTNITSSTTTNNNSNKTRQIHPICNEKGTGSSTLAGHKKNLPMASTMASTRSVDQKQQQQPLKQQHGGELTALRNGQNSQNMSKFAKTTTTNETAALAATTKTGPAATNTVSGTAASSHGKQRERISSLQSHYSTDKSGSSGYYSSNVCSTYSIEDHIYCEPVIDVLDLNSKSKSVLVASKSNKTVNSSNNNNNCINSNISNISSNIKQKQLQLLQSSQNSNNNNNSHSGKLTPTSVNTPIRQHTVEQSENPLTHSVSGSRNRAKNMHGAAHSEQVACEKAVEETHEAVVPRAHTGLLPNFKLNPLLTSEALAAPHLSENLRILETSIENLDRHLKAFPSLSSQEQITAFVQTHQHNFAPQLSEEHRVRSYQHLPTIMESFDPAAYEAPSNKQQPRPTHWPVSTELADDSLHDIDLDSFLLVNERVEKRQQKRGKQAALSGIDNPTFLTNEPDEEEEELEENNYKCAKYINSCPEDAYRVESDIAVGSASPKSSSMEHFLKRYEDQIHFQNTRELLEDVRDKIRLLSRASSDSDRDPNASPTPQLPQELNGMIKTLKLELETYLARMNQHSELEIRQLCSGLVKNQHIVKMKKAFERRRSIASLSALESEYDFSAYEALRDGVLVSAAGVPLGIRQQITSIRCASDPNFKMKRKSLTEVFPVPDFYVENVDRAAEQPRAAANYENVIVEMSSGTLTMAAQRNLSFHQPILNQLDAKVGPGGGLATGDGLVNGASASGSGSGSGGESGDKESIMEWHRQKPSAWEMYYGTNRMSQSLLGKRGMIVNTNQASLSYPSSRPESDFTLDLPRAEQLRIKMEKEKKFRQRCRYITSFLSLVFFLLTVMVVSLVLTRGKRMFGSMI